MASCSMAVENKQPLQHREKSGQCEWITEALQGLPKVIYFDDVGVQPEDPNGIQEIPIVMGLHKWKINLLAVGTNSNKSGTAPHSYQLLKDITARSQHQDIAIIDRQDIAEKIVNEANCLDPNQFLYVALGGEWFELMDALLLDESIASRIIAIGIEVSNGNENPTKQNAFNFVQSKLGDRAIAIDHLNENLEPTGQIQYFSDHPQSLRIFHTFRNSTIYRAEDFDAIYDSQIKGILTNITDNSDRDITASHQYYIRHSRILNNSLGAGTRTNTKLRLADYLTVAYIFDKDNLFDTVKMHRLIERAVDNF